MYKTFVCFRRQELFIQIMTKAFFYLMLIFSMSSFQYSIHVDVIHANIQLFTFTHTRSHEHTFLWCTHISLFMQLFRYLRLMLFIFFSSLFSFDFKHGNFLIIMLQRRRQIIMTFWSFQLAFINKNYFIGKRIKGSQTLLSMARLCMCQMHINCWTTTSYGRTG